MISMNKQYRTRDGKKVRIYAVDAGGYCPVHGAYLNQGEYPYGGGYYREWVHYCWTDNGWCPFESQLELKEIKEGEGL